MTTMILKNATKACNVEINLDSGRSKMGNNVCAVGSWRSGFSREVGFEQSESSEKLGTRAPAAKICVRCDSHD